MLVIGCAHYAIRQGGMSTSELMEKVGPPQEIRKGPSNTEIWVYKDYPLDFYYYIENNIVVGKRSSGAGPPF